MKFESEGYSKASPNLRWMAQQQEGAEDWRPDMARQQAAVWFAPPDAPEPEGRGGAQVSSREARMNVYLHLNRAAQSVGLERFALDIGADEKIEIAAKSGVGIASLTEAQLEEVLKQPQVASADIAEAIKRPLVLRSSLQDGRPIAPPAPRAALHEDLHHGGRGVLIGIVDVDGFDFAHEDFVVDGGTRFVRIWDQGSAGPRPGPLRDGRRLYGAEFTREHLNKAIADSGALGIAPYHIEAQSSSVPGSHGTHVASIAAGARGLCPNADIAAVLIHLPDEDWERRRSFSDSTRIADAVEYLLSVRRDLGYDALSINISLGTNGHAHDGTSGACRWIESELDQQGVAACIAAGNAGQEAPTSIDDLGFVVGRIHTSGVVPAAGLTQDLQIQVAGYPIEDTSENKLEIWYSPQDRIAVSVRPPRGAWIGPIEPGSDSGRTNALGWDGKSLETEVSVFNDIYRPENGSNHVTVFLSPVPKPGSLTGGRVHPGVWTIRLHAREIRDGRYDGWIERDDPIPVWGISPQRLWHYPSFFTEESNIDRSSLSTLASTRSSIAVGNLDEEAERVAITSSQGPTRDGRPKPELLAPGTRIVAANGFHPTQPWIAMSGTSMASPYVAGVAALMFAVEPRLTSSQVRAIMIRTTSPLPGADYAWHDDTGFGRIDPARCIEEAKALKDVISGGAP